jgi:arabinose-5-phosphate isomerase
VILALFIRRLEAGELEPLAEEVLVFLNESKITSAFVIDRKAPVNTGVPIGIVHIHDFLRVGLG